MITRQPWPYTKLDEISSAWKGLEDYILPLIEHFNVTPEKALEFGVDYGYSAHILSKAFTKVIGVDLFEGDIHVRHQQGEDFYQQVKSRFKDTNVEIIKSSFENFISNNENFYNLIHIDIVHLYEPTFKCAEWSVQHSNLVILHDTMSFPEIHKVCLDISNKHGMSFHNIPEHHGLGILYRTA